MVPTTAAGHAPHRLRGRVGIGVRSAFRLLYPSYESDDDLLAQSIAPYLRPDMQVLDAGCGSGAFFRYSWKDEVQLLVGCDLSEGLAQNPNVDSAIFADLARLPFACEAFDLIFSRYVLEHIDRPEDVFAELARVLKPGGKLIVLTPSKYHYVTLFSRLMPHRVHEFVSRIRGNTAGDAFPTRYLINSKADLERYARQAGLRLVTYVAKEMSPNYLLWSLPSFLLGAAYERLVNRFELLSPLRVTIVAVLER